MSPPGASSPIGSKNLLGWNSPSSKVTWPKLKCISICETRIVDLGWLNVRTCNFLVSPLKSTKFLCFNARGITVNQVCYRFSVCRSAPDIFVVKVWSCPKSRRILNLNGSTFHTTCNFFVCGPISWIFLLNPAGIVVDQVCFRFLLSWSVPKISAVKIKSWPISGQI